MVNLKVSLAAFMVFLLQSLTVFAERKPENAEGQTIRIKQGQSVTLRAASGNALAFQWLRNGSVISGEIQDTYVVNTAGNYQVRSLNTVNCLSELSDPVTVIVDPPVGPPAITADVAITIAALQGKMTVGQPFVYQVTVKNNGPQPASAITIEDKIPAGIQFVELTKPAKGSAGYNSATNQINWLIDVLAVGESITLTFKVTPITTGPISKTGSLWAETSDMNMANNSYTSSFTVAGLTFPNVFTPNGDLVNDTFEIQGLEIYPNNELTILNRWGGTVYKKKNYKHEWTGHGLSEGTYFYVLSVQDGNGKWQAYKGYTTLLRNKL